MAFEALARGELWVAEAENRGGMREEESRTVARQRPVGVAPGESVNSALTCPLARTRARASNCTGVSALDAAIAALAPTSAAGERCRRDGTPGCGNATDTARRAADPAIGPGDRAERSCATLTSSEMVDPLVIEPGSVRRFLEEDCSAP